MRAFSFRWDGFGFQGAHSTLYVDATTGDDKNNGMSSTTAVATIQRAVDLALDNTTIEVAAGVYKNEKWRDTTPRTYLKNNGAVADFGSMLQHITIRNAPGARPIIQFDGDGGIHAREIHHFELFGFEIIGKQQRHSSRPPPFPNPPSSFE